MCNMNYKLSEIAGTLCDILRLANNQISTTSAEYYLTEKIELLSDLLNRNCKTVSDIARAVDNKNFRQCDYIFHALFWALREKAPFKILNQLSDEKVLMLKDVIDVAKTQIRPTDQESQSASILGKDYCRKNEQVKSNEIQKAQNNVVRFSAFITVTVSKYWDGAVAELEKWSDAIDERMSSISLTSVKKVRQPNLPINPQKWELERNAALAKEKQQNIAAPVVDQEPQQIIAPAPKEITPAPQQKQEEKQDMKKTEFWSTKELSEKLGYTKITSFHMRKLHVKETHPEILDWFSKDGRKFDSTHFEELKAIFQERKKRSKGSSKPTEPAQTPTVQPAPVPATDGYAVIESKQIIAVNPEAESTPIGGIDSIEQPTDLLGIKGLETYLEKLNTLYNNALKNEKNLQHQLHEAKVLTEKYNKKLTETKDLIEEYKKAEIDLSDAERTMKQNKEKINVFLYEASLERVN